MYSSCSLLLEGLLVLVCGQAFLLVMSTAMPNLLSTYNESYFRLNLFWLLNQAVNLQFRYYHRPLNDEDGNEVA
jgi:hypothetical protein